MQENRDHFFSEIENIHLNIFHIKPLKVILVATQLFSMFSISKANFPPYFLSFTFPPNSHLFGNGKHCPSIYPSSIQNIHLSSSIIQPSSIHHLSRHSSNCPPITHPSFIHHPSRRPSYHPSNQPFILFLLVRRICLINKHLGTIKLK